MHLAAHVARGCGHVATHTARRYIRHRPLRPMLTQLLRRPAAAAAASGGGCCRLALHPLGVVAPAAPLVRLFAAGPAPKQKSSKMRKKLRNGIHTHCIRCFQCLLQSKMPDLTSQRRVLCFVVHAAGQRARSPTLKAVKPQECPRCGVLKLPHTYACSSCRR